ncbi:uncharacterized protein LOC144924968 isoform X2 [Branchiostoma floridae x Branchiostoma belcheri]
MSEMEEDRAPKHEANKGEEVHSDSDDEAPEDVSFTTSRQVALQAMKTAIQETKKSEEAAKEKRKKKDELFKQQKKQKIQPLPLDVLKEVEAARTRELEMKTQLKQQKSETKASQAVQRRKNKPARAVGEGYEAVVLDEEVQKARPKSETAAQFLQKQLYGTRIRREPVGTSLAAQNKHNHKPAAHFTVQEKEQKKTKKKSKKDSQYWMKKRTFKKERRVKEAIERKLLLKMERRAQKRKLRGPADGIDPLKEL